MADHAFSRFRTSSFAFLPALLLAWIGGTSFGCSLYEPLPVTLMHSVVITPMSIVGVFVCVFLPLVCTYFSFLLDKLIIILIVCFLKAVAFSFSGALIWHYFQSAGWLICFFMMFSDCCFSIVFLTLLLRYFSCACIRPMSDLFVCTAIGICIATADYFVISPFLQGLL